jgi:hypothetical protein
VYLNFICFWFDRGSFFIHILAPSRAW